MISPDDRDGLAEQSKIDQGRPANPLPAPIGGGPRGGAVAIRSSAQRVALRCPAPHAGEPVDLEGAAKFGMRIDGGEVKLRPAGGTTRPQRGCGQTCGQNQLPRDVSFWKL